MRGDKLQTTPCPHRMGYYIMYEIIFFRALCTDCGRKGKNGFHSEQRGVMASSPVSWACRFLKDGTFVTFLYLQPLV